MDPWNGRHRQRRLLCSERLEGRWFLSAAAATDPAQPDADAPGESLAGDDADAVTGVMTDGSPPLDGSGAVVVVEMGRAEEDDNEDAAIDLEDVPDPVVAAFHARFPGARVMGAELELEDDQREYDITAEFDGAVLDVSLSPSGEISEVEQELASADLPESVRAWVRQNFANASIDEASMVDGDGDTIYEVLIAPPGRDAIEATLRVPDEQAAPVDPPAAGEDPVAPPDDETPASEDVASFAPPAQIPAAGATAAERAASIPVPYPEAQRTASVDAASEQRAADAGRSDDEAEVLVTAGDAGDDDERAAAALDDRTAALAAAKAVSDRVLPAAWTPELAGVLGQVLPVNVGAVERELKRVLAEIGQLTNSMRQGAPAVSDARGLALAAALVVAAQFVLLDWAREGGGPLLVFDAANSTWSWVLGSARPSDPARPEAQP